MRSGFADEVEGVTGPVPQGGTMIPSRLEIYAIVLALVAAVGLGGYFYVKHLQNKVVTLQDKVDSVEAKNKVLDGKMDKFQKFMETRSRATKKVTNDQDAIRQSETTGNDADLDARLDSYGMQPHQGGPAGPGRKGGTRNAAPGAP